jgi:hypothetical protein
MKPFNLTILRGYEGDARPSVQSKLWPSKPESVAPSIRAPVKRCQELLQTFVKAAVAVRSPSRTSAPRDLEDWQLEG